MRSELEVRSQRDRNRWRWSWDEVTGVGVGYLEEEGTGSHSCREGRVIDQDPRDTQWETAHRGTGAVAATVG